MISTLPTEIIVNILTFLRATDLGRLQSTCRSLNEPTLIHTIIDRFANDVYPPELTVGFDTAAVGGELNSKSCPGNSFWTSYEVLRNMEMVVVARILSRPEPPLAERLNGGFYVSKAWCKATLKWLDFQSEERRRRQRELTEARKDQESSHYKMSKKSKKNSRKQSKMCDLQPPSSNVNADITCEHGRLVRCDTSRVRSKLRVVDKQCWRVLKKIFPDGAQLNAIEGECLQCVLEAEMDKRNAETIKQKESDDRKKPLSCPLVRGFYSRRNGVPKDSLVPELSVSLHEYNFSSPMARRTTSAALFGRADPPLLPGVYSCLPRSWCHSWRKYIKSGGNKPPAPDSSCILCDAHRLPLLPPHLESFLNGETNNLFDVSNSMSLKYAMGSNKGDRDGSRNPIPVGLNPVEFRLGGRHRAERTMSFDDPEMDMTILRESGMPESEIQLQRLAFLQIEEDRERQRRHQNIMRRQSYMPQQENESTLSPEEVRANINAQLDRENRVLVEILTDEEMTALEHLWPGIHCYILKFAVIQSECSSSSHTSLDVIWTTAPCRHCDPSSRTPDCSIGLFSKSRYRKK